MTAQTTTRTTAPGAAAGGFLRRNRVPLLLVIGVVIVLGSVTWANRDRGSVGGALDPGNARPGGARAVAQVLADQGVEVQVVRGKAAFAGARIDAGTTVVMSNPAALGASTWTDLDAKVSAAGAVLVVVGLDPVVSDGLGLRGTAIVPGPTRSPVPADCDPAIALMDGLSLSTDVQATAVTGDGCFGTDGGRLLLIDRQQHRWVLTDPAPLSNDQVDRGDNAAVALRLLGQRDRVVWYVARSGDTAISDGIGVGRLLPRWLVPSLWLLGLATLALLLVRGRRFGPLVVEPIPVAIKALESTTALGRLYEQARDRTHAAGLLVDGSARRLGPLLGLAENTGRHDLVRAVADRTGRPVASVAALLPGRDVPAGSIRSDADLVALAQNLHQLEEEVRTR